MLHDSSSIPGVRFCFMRAESNPGHFSSTQYFVECETTCLRQSHVQFRVFLVITLFPVQIPIRTNRQTKIWPGSLSLAGEYQTNTEKATTEKTRRSTMRSGCHARDAYTWGWGGGVISLCTCTIMTTRMRETRPKTKTKNCYAVEHPGLEQKRNGKKKSLIFLS